MLPYRLRPPVYGRKLREQLEDEEGLARGGPIERAIIHDLTALKPSFHLLVQQQQQQQQQDNEIATTPTTDHAKPATAFSAFKTIFGTSKVARLHSYVPLKCDREAFSELIYSCCLCLLKSSFDAEPFCLEDASFSLFMLYALLETNPLPRSTETDIELLPFGLQSADNPKFLYRRTFAPKIRIDRYHYSLLLRLRELSLARQADCQTECMRSYQERISGTTTTTTTSSTNNKWTCCTCGMAQDTCQVVDRILPHLDLCEYTGPVSLEGLVGHADYPYATDNKDTSTSSNDIVSSPSLAEASSLGASESETFSLSSNLEQSMAEYQSRLQSIRLPDIKSHAVARIRKALDPIFSSSSSSTREPWTDVKTRIFSLGGNRTSAETNTVSAAAAAATTLERIAPRPRVSFAKESWQDTTNHDPEIQEAAASAINTEQTTTDDDPTYELILPDDLAGTMIQEGMMKSLQVLLEREGRLQADESLVSTTPMPPPRLSAGADADDVSSIGNGGISVATGQGQAALQQLLLASVQQQQQHTTGVPRVATIPRKSWQAPVSSTRPGDSFLAMNSNIFEPDNDYEYSDEEDSTSDVSHLSSQDDNDEMSLATSAVGERALQLLLSNVTESSPQRDSSNKRKRKKGKTSPRKRAAPRKATSKRKSNTRDDESSLATSIGEGRAALDVLLSQAVAGRSEAIARTRDGEMDMAEHLEENQSLAGTSVGQGETALEMLLSKVNEGGQEAV
jgi:hypothetical protein